MARCSMPSDDEIISISSPIRTILRHETGCEGWECTICPNSPYAQCACVCVVLENRRREDVFSNANSTETSFRKVGSYEWYVKEIII